MTKNTFTTAYNRTTKSIRDCSVVKFEKPSMVKESLAYATDINEIYKNYTKTGKLPLNGKQPLYDENFVKYDSLIEAQKIINEASEYFVGLPAEIKAQYGNSLEKFVKALNGCDPYLIEKGVLQVPVKEEKEPETPVTPVTEPVQEPVTPVNTATTD